MAKQTVYVIHGYRANPGAHWFPWLKEKLSAAGVQAFVLPMPNSKEPDVQVWGDFLDANIHSHDENTFFVAHSLGCITLLHHLEHVKNTIGGLVLASGFSEPLPALSELDAFAKPGYRPEHIAKIAKHRSVVVSLNDYLVPPPLTKKLAREIRANLREVPKGGHFLSDDGFLELPVVYEELKAML
jgi:uncharacterized protein